MQIDMRSTKPLRILMLGPALKAKGGISSVCSTLLVAVPSEQVRIRFIATMKVGSKLKKLFIGCCGFAELIWNVRGVDLAHIHVATRTSFWRKLIFAATAKFLGLPYILHLHGGEFQIFFERECNSLQKNMVSWAFNNAAAVIVLSEWWKEYISSTVTNNSQITILHNAVNSDSFYKGNHSKNVLLFLGRISQLKGIYDLLPVMRSLREKHPDVCLRCGGDGELDRVKQTIRDLEMDDCVELLGWVVGEQKTAELRNAAVFVLPSYNEGLPVSILEAMANSLPVVSTLIGGIPEAVTDGVEGFLIKPGDRNRLYDCLDSLLSKPELREEMGQSAYRKCKELFDVKMIWKELYQIYLKAVER